MRATRKLCSSVSARLTYEESLFGAEGTMRRVEVNPTMALALHQTILDESHEGIRQSPEGWGGVVDCGCGWFTCGEASVE